MINGNSTLIQVFQLYQNKIKEKEHRNWRFNAAKYRLNPCCNGRWPRTNGTVNHSAMSASS